jgi:hypothetical protein
VFKNLTEDQVAGTVTPHLMADTPGNLDRVVDRIAETCPQVKLIAYCETRSIAPSRTTGAHFEAAGFAIRRTSTPSRPTAGLTAAV